MDVQYQEVLKRFIENREAVHMSQKQLAGLLGVSQGYVSKMELGTARIPFDILVVLNENEWDIDRIITGKESEYTELDELIDKCQENVRDEFIQLVIWTVKQGLYKFDREVRLIERYVRKMNVVDINMQNRLAEESPSALYGIRAANKLSQQNMAKKLHMDVKKYRALERNEKHPDAEILMLLYNNFEYRPFRAISGDADLSEINRIWARFKPDEKAVLLDFLQHGYVLVNR